MSKVWGFIPGNTPEENLVTLSISVKEISPSLSDRKKIDINSSSLIELLNIKEAKELDEFYLLIPGIFVAKNTINLVLIEGNTLEIPAVHKVIEKNKKPVSHLFEFKANELKAALTAKYATQELSLNFWRAF